jgi:para-aminobenzoate synthetase component 1
LFPGGSITGAPKRKAMEWIRELEGRPRGIYTGSMGYWSFNGEARFNIAIRTGFFREGVLEYWTGSGIVADSEAEAEYGETLDKLKGLLKGLGKDVRINLP